MKKKQQPCNAHKRKNNPLGILVALLLIALSSPNYAAQTHADWDGQTVIVQTQVQDKFGFATEWGGLSLKPVHDRAGSRLNNNPT